MSVKKYVSYGDGHCGDSDDIEDVRRWVANNKSGAVYVLLDNPTESTMETPDQEIVRALALFEAASMQLSAACYDNTIDFETARNRYVEQKEQLLALIAPAPPAPESYVATDGLGQKVLVPGNVTFEPWTAPPASTVHPIVSGSSSTFPVDANLVRLTAPPAPEAVTPDESAWAQQMERVREAAQNYGKCCQKLGIPIAGEGNWVRPDCMSASKDVDARWQEFEQTLFGLTALAPGAGEME